MTTIRTGWPASLLRVGQAIACLANSGGLGRYRRERRFRIHTSGGGRRSLKMAILPALSLVLAVPAAGQAPTPAQGRDYTNLVYRVLSVDSSGRLIVSPTGAVTQCTAMTPCIVIGPAADGAAVSGNPVRIAGKDPSGNTQDILTNSAGNPVPSNDAIAGADGVSNTVSTPSNSVGVQVYNRIFPYLFNGATNDRDFSCPNTLRVNVAATGPTEIIPLTGGQTIRVCSFSATTAAAAALDVSFVNGTGANCGTGTATLAGTYSAITALDLFSKDAPLTVPSGNALCLTNSAATALTGVVIFAKY